MASGLRPDRVPTALPMSWGPLTSTTIRFMPPAAPVSALRAALLPLESQTTARVLQCGHDFFTAPMSAS